MTTLRVLLVDDVELARQKLARALGAHADVEIVGEAANGAEMIAAVANTRPDLVFLDIAMPEQDGFAALSALPPQARPSVIFLTAYAQHALAAFRVDAVDYLLKPVEPTLLAQALQRVRRRRQPAQPGRLDTPAQAWPERLALRTDSGVRMVPVATIRWIEAIRNYLAFHLADGTLIVRSTLQGVLAQLDPERFARVHRSAIVRLDAVRELRPLRNGDQRLLLDDGTAIGISRTHREAVLQRLTR